MVLDRTNQPLTGDTKSALRTAMRARRRAEVASLTAAQRQALESALAAHVLPLLQQTRSPGSYLPHGAEISPAIIEAEFGGEISWPFFEDRAAAMDFRSGSGRVDGPWGVPQPEARGSGVHMPDALLVPLLAATAEGLRLGQGGGHYDRYLAARRAAGGAPLTVGLAWDCQIVEELPADPWDETLDYIATPTRLYGPA